MRGSRNVGLLLLVGLALAMGAAAPAAALDANPLRDPTPNAPDAVDETHTVTFTKSMTGLALESTFVIYELEFPNLGSRTAEEIRGTIGLYQPLLEEALLDAVREALEASFPNAQVGVRIAERDFGRNDGDLDPYRPGIVYKVASQVRFTPAYFFGEDVPGLDLEELILGTFRMGGTFVADFRLQPRAGHLVNVAVSVPPWLVLEGATADGRFRATADNRSGLLPGKPVTLRIHVPDLPERLARFDGSGGDVEVRVDMHDARVPLGGGDGSLTLDVDVDVRLHHLAMTQELQGILPPYIEMDHANADYLRLSIANGLILEQPFADSLVRLVEWNLRYVLGEDAEVTVDRALLDATLHAPYDPAVMDAAQPVRVAARARVVQSVPVLKDGGDPAPLMAAALFDAVKVQLSPQTYVVKSFYTWDTRYTFLFPVGMDAKVSDALGRGARAAVDGRDAFRLTLTGGEYDQVTIGGSLGALFFTQAVVGTDSVATTSLVLALALAALLGGGALAVWRLRVRRARARLASAPRTLIWGPSGAPLAAPVVVGKRARPTRATGPRPKEANRRASQWRRGHTGRGDPA